MKSLLFVVLCSGVLYGQLTRSQLSDTLDVTPAEKYYADTLFNIASGKLKFLDYNDCNNCPLRAHVMTFVLTALYPEIKTGKVWLFADSKLSSRRDHYKTRAKQYLSGIISCKQWGFHVAPVIIFDGDTLVIDPSTQPGAVSVNTWAGKISSSTASLIIFKRAEYYSYPEDEYDLFKDNAARWEEKYSFRSAESEVNFLAQRLTKAYHGIYDPVKFNYYKSMISSSLMKN